MTSLDALAVSTSGQAIQKTSATTFGNVSIATSANAFFQSGNAFGATAVIGTTDANRFDFITGGSVRMSISASAALLGIGTTAPTHTLTIPSTGTGFVHYNTSDQTTNYERAIFSWSANVYTINIAKGGSGTQRALDVLAGGIGLRIQAAFPVFSSSVSYSSGNNASVMLDWGVNVQITTSSVVASVMGISPTIIGSGTGGYSVLLINPTESSTGSGVKRLISAQVGSVDKFAVDNTGTVTVGIWSGTAVAVAKGGTGGTSASITLFNNITGYSAAGATGTTSTNLVFSTSPTLVTPVLGAATATSINGLVITTTTGTITMTNGKTLAVTQTITLTGTDSTVMTFPTTSATIARTDAAQTFTGTQTFSQWVTTANTVTVSSNAGTVPVTSQVNNFTNSSASAMTITMTTTNAVDGQISIVRIFDASAVAKGITWVNTENSASASAPANSAGSTSIPLTVGFRYNSGTSKWTCLAST